jgi:drug/metabolite transporter (DMT)-like permease
VELYDWLLFFHVASAAALISALVTFWTIAVAARNVDRPADSVRYFRIARPANALVIIGTIGVLVFGIWLVIDVDEYELWDGWILGALVLWAIGTAAGIRGGRPYGEAQKLAVRLDGEGRGAEPSTELRTLLQDRPAMWLNVVSTLAVLLILIDMIYKPGA